MLYFAYGSNLNHFQMTGRCPKAKPLIKVILNGYRLVFRHGVANVLPDKLCTVTGALWEITPQCLRSLDRYEGYPKLYTRSFLEVINENNVPVKALVYYMVQDLPQTPISSYYLNTIIEGYRDFGLSFDSLKQSLRLMGASELSLNSVFHNRIQA